jgi:pimeloyl-ACP methyl ester carboxylesterase
MASPLPTIVLVHGAWHTPANYRSFTTALETHDFKVHVPHLPSCRGTRTSVSNASFPEDVAHVCSVVKPLIEASGQVIMVMHSYGGAVGTEAISGIPSTSDGIIHLFYICAYILPPGLSIFSISKKAGFLPLWSQFIDNFEDGSCFPKGAGQMFFSSQTPDLIKVAEKHLVRHPLSAFKEQMKGDAWKRFPVLYVMTQNDWGVPRVYQEIMLEKVKKEGVEVRIEDYDACHSVFVTLKDEIVEAVVRAVEDERNAKMLN